MTPDTSDVVDSAPAGEPAVSALLRNEPSQARSSARLTRILDAAAAVVHEFGYERLTTALVGERSSSSIGTVYRYFPDRLTILQALAARNLGLLRSEWLTELDDAGWVSWLDAVDSLLDYQASAFRTVPSFRSLRYGDPLDVRPSVAGGVSIGLAAEWVALALTERYEIDGAPELRDRLEVALTLSDSLLARAFTLDDQGDERIIGEARSIARNYLIAHFGDPRDASC